MEELRACFEQSFGLPIVFTSAVPCISPNSAERQYASGSDRHASTIGALAGEKCMLIP